MGHEGDMVSDNIDHEEFAEFYSSCEAPKVRRFQKVSEPEYCKCRDCCMRNVRDCLTYSCKVV